MTADDAKNHPAAPSAGPTTAADPDYRLSRWFVYFASGSEWASVGEFVAPDEAGAVERAREVFGDASAYRAEKIPWDCAPFHRPRA
jgi:hypothetical protein